MCISWTIKGLISLMHGITMKSTKKCWVIARFVNFRVVGAIINLKTWRNYVCTFHIYSQTWLKIGITALYARLFRIGEFPWSRRLEGLNDLWVWIKLYWRVYRKTRTFWIKNELGKSCVPCHVAHYLLSRFLDIFLNTAYNVRWGVLKSIWLDNRCSVTRMCTEHKILTEGELNLLVLHCMWNKQ